ncbi:MAG: hypothetical protein JWN38_945 [Candidatus Saccharibacteria bacterium]|nr:hypothetical protein [Candidatus Saccharibacteria bacterium]
MSKTINWNKVADDQYNSLDEATQDDWSDLRRLTR